MTSGALSLDYRHEQTLFLIQRAENVQLCSVIKKLQAEVSDYKDRLKKLEEEVSSFKQKEEVAPKQVIGTMPAGTTEPLKKRGRPKQSLELADALNESHLDAVGKKPATCNSLSLCLRINHSLKKLDHPSSKKLFLKRQKIKK